MKKYNFLFMALLVMVAVTSCNKGPGYIYIDNQSDEPKVSFIESEDDAEAYNKAFENYSTARFYPVFSEFEKTHRYIAENEGNGEACESDEGEAAPPDDSNGVGAVISTGDDVTSIDGMGQEPVYEELSKFNTPNFMLYKITDGSARKAAQDFINKKISYEEFEKVLEGNTEAINFYDKNFDSCVAIDRKVFDNLLSKLRATLSQIDKEVATRKAEAHK